MSDEGFIIRSGLSPKDAPFPSPELDIGNVVRLKKAYPDIDNGRLYQWGIIVEHVSRNAWGIPQVGLNVYDDNGQLLMEDDAMPSVVDLVASKLILWHLIGTIGYQRAAPDGHDLYPTCDGCRDEDQHPFGDDPCPQCGGWGHVKEMRRLPAAPDAPKG